ncbi:MAG: type VI secretion system-associated protein TagF [Thermodesulfobacteriota bacterium]
MLGLGRSAGNWQWHLSGKHPVAKDFFAIGDKNPMAEAFAQWIRLGAEQSAAGREMLAASCSWRFWAKTGGREILVCGVIRNSCDFMGRPYPLLVMGSGLLERWEENWELLPLACEGLWSQMEQLATKNYQGFDRLKEDLHMLRPPQARWQDLRDKGAELVAGLSPGDLPDPAAGAQEALFLPLQCADHGDPFALIIYLHRVLKEKIRSVPNILFVGGPLEQPGFALFTRPLNTGDFTRMWEPVSAV